MNKLHSILRLTYVYFRPRLHIDHNDAASTLQARNKGPLVFIVAYRQRLRQEWTRLVL